jgi:hypothetical protein
MIFPFHLYKPPEKKRAAMVCGAGLSLDLHLSLILKEREKLWVAAVDRVYPLLVNIGIVPDVVVTLDPLKTLTSCTLPIPLMAPTVSNPLLLKNWKGDIYLYNLYDDNSLVLRSVYNSFKGLTGIYSKPNVGEMAVAISTIFSKQVAFTGLDFATYSLFPYALGKPIERLDGIPKVDDLFMQYSNCFMTNYSLYSERATLYNLSKGCLPLPYQLNSFIRHLRIREL